MILTADQDTVLIQWLSHTSRYPTRDYRLVRGYLHRCPQWSKKLMLIGGFKLVLADALKARQMRTGVRARGEVVSS